MAKTIFQKVTFRNFLSIGNGGMEYELNKNSHTLITGKNGEGKSSMMDAITYALFNKPFRDINLPLLINSINGKDMLVEIEFTTNNIAYKVIRGMKPNIFEIWCNGELLNQESKNRDYQKILETQILKMNYKTFIQVVIIGSANLNIFMKLPANQRREIVDYFLDTGILAEMNKCLKIKVNDTKNFLTTVNNDISTKNEVIKVKEKHVKQMEADKSYKISEIENELKELESQEDEILSAINSHEELIEQLTSEVEKVDSILENVTKMNMFEKRFKTNISDAESKIKYFKEITHCPQCEQDICDNHKKIMIDKNSDSIKEQEKELKELIERNDQLKKKLEKIRDKERELSLNAKLLTAKSAELKMVKSTQIKLNNELNGLKAVGNIESEVESLKTLAGETIGLIEQKKTLTNERNLQDLATQLLKDQGIKTSIVRKYLPTLNSLINKYCAELDFFVLFEFNENFDESIKSRHRDKFQYGSFSEGQKKRIDFAIIFAWRELIRQKNNIDTNLLILDEVFDSSLDDDGVDLFNNIIFGSMMKDYNVFLISHKPKWAEAFPNHIQVEMKNNFTVFKDKE